MILTDKNASWIKVYHSKQEFVVSFQLLQWVVSTYLTPIDVMIMTRHNWKNSLIQKSGLTVSHFKDRKIWSKGCKNNSFIWFFSAAINNDISLCWSSKTCKSITKSWSCLVKLASRMALEQSRWNCIRCSTADIWDSICLSRECATLESLLSCPLGNEFSSMPIILSKLIVTSFSSLVTFLCYILLTYIQ